MKTNLEAWKSAKLSWVMGACALLSSVLVAEEVAVSVAALDVPDIARTTAPAAGKKVAVRVNAADHDFLQQVAAALQVEAELAHLAVDRELGDEALSLATELSASRRQLVGRLEQLAIKKGVSLETKLGWSHSEDLATLRAQPASVIEAAYRESVARARTELAQLVVTAARTTRDREIRTFAEQVYHELRAGRPLAAAAAVESARKDMDIARVALNPGNATAVAAPGNRSELSSSQSTPQGGAVQEQSTERIATAQPVSESSLRPAVSEARLERPSEVDEFSPAPIRVPARRWSESADGQVPLHLAPRPRVINYPGPVSAMRR